MEASIGDRFDPSKSELLTCLRNKAKKGNNGCITDMDVYENDPWLLQHVTPHPHFVEGKWFYFVPTTQGGGGSKLKRTVPGRNGGTWRSTGGERKIREGTVIGYKQSFLYYKKVKGNPKENITDWWMTEFSLCDDELQDWVLCKIQHKPSLEKKVNNMEYEQKEESALDDEFVQMVLEEDGDFTGGQQQETHVLSLQGQDLGFKTTQRNNTKWWDDLVYEKLQKLPGILQGQDSRGFVDQGIVGGDTIMYRTNRGFELENSGCICVTLMKDS